ncbi:unnamed protein product [Protopolystoma xenopodis]|uniref:Uncharacterized protein n=1 Tax=Protopolystoma xenopodis TaxID=117903 RepID=A0A3S5A149_9PLAT|nr:unnamed protein product [Protopolystoma xenopodis]
MIASRPGSVVDKFIFLFSSSAFRSPLVGPVALAICQWQHVPDPRLSSATKSFGISFFTFRNVLCSGVYFPELGWSVCKLTSPSPLTSFKCLFGTMPGPLHSPTKRYCLHTSYSFTSSRKRCISISFDQHTLRFHPVPSCPQSRFQLSHPPCRRAALLISSLGTILVKQPSSIPLREGVSYACRPLRLWEEHAFDTKLKISHFTLHISYFTLHTSFFILNTLFFTLPTLNPYAPYSAFIPLPPVGKMCAVWRFINATSATFSTGPLLEAQQCPFSMFTCPALIRATSPSGWLPRLSAFPHLVIVVAWSHPVLQAFTTRTVQWTNTGINQINGGMLSDEGKKDDDDDDDDE